MASTSQAEALDTTRPHGKVAMIGTGKMGGILLSAFLDSGLLGRDQVIATAAHPERVAAIEAALHIRATTDNIAAAKEADILILGVKPTQVLDVIQQIVPTLSAPKLLISIAASVTTNAIESAAGHDVAVIRAMPNTPAKLGAGMTALVRGRYTTPEQVQLARRMFCTVGRVVVVDEKHMDAVTGLSGSGPAFLYIILEALAEAGVNVGLPRDVATELAAQTAYGAARMVLETGAHPALLKDEVTTPAGCTVDGILELEAGGLRVTLIKAVKRATERARELALLK